MHKSFINCEIKLFEKNDWVLLTCVLCQHNRVDVARSSPKIGTWKDFFFLIVYHFTLFYTAE